VGRYVGLEAYICDESGIELQSGVFSAKGDSGTAIFTGDGRSVGILHSGTPKGDSVHVTFAMPGESSNISKAHYLHADLWHETF